ncbi:MAG: hypothetical protein PHS97_05515 [Oscillospiraceae bacterium]|nr:hypothetical protein [Oscillospiraceae bacterium]
MGNDLIIANETVAALDKAAANGLLAQKEASQFKRMMLVSMAIGELKNLLTPKIMEPVMHLQNTSIGFKTDNPSGYPVDVVRECLIEATLKGVFPVGNEFNIISRQCYITKAGYFHKLRDIPNFSWIETPGIPRNVGDTGAVIKVHLEWTLNKQKFDKELELAIRVNRGMGSDAIIGKALRKARAWLYTGVTGQEVGDGDVDSDIVDVPQIKEAQSPFEEQPVSDPEKTDELPM